VSFIENPWYDDHFDLDRDSLKLGKTFVSVARGNSDLIGRSYQLIGWALYEKFESGLTLLRDCVKSGSVPAVTQEAVRGRQCAVALWDITLWDIKLDTLCIECVIV